MSILPDEIWSRILELGTGHSRLSHRDLCCVAATSRRLNRLSGDPAFWSTLLALDFPHLSPSSPSPRSLYKASFEKDRARRLTEWRRAVLVTESEVAVGSNNIKNLEFMMSQEGDRMKAAVDELSHLQRVRRASVALNVWQPEVVRGRQKQMVEQCTVPIESRLSALNMEVKVCKQQILTYNKAYNDQKRKLSDCKEALASLKYQPLSNYQLSASINVQHKKQKKLKRSIDLLMKFLDKGVIFFKAML